MKTRSKNTSHGSLSLQALRSHLVPVMVWSVAAACVVTLVMRRVNRFELVGIARGRVAQVAASSSGRLGEVRVALYDKVKAGDVVAVIDTILDNEFPPELVEAQIATINAEIDRLNAELQPTKDTLTVEKAERETSHVEAMRNFEVDIERTRLQILGIKAQLASDTMTLQDYASDINILGVLVARDAIAPYELEKVRAQHGALDKKITESNDMLLQAEKDLAKATTRQEEYAKLELVHPGVDQALEVIRKSISVQEKMVEELKVTRVPVELRAPIDGIVVPIHGQANERILDRPGENLMKTAGEVVAAGEPILAIAQEKPSEIIAYVGQAGIGSFRENMMVELVKNREPAQLAKAKVMSVGPAVEALPERLWPSPTAPQWGRPIVINIPAGLNLVPGELIGIRGL